MRTGSNCEINKCEKLNCANCFIDSTTGDATCSYSFHIMTTTVAIDSSNTTKSYDYTQYIEPLWFIT